MPQYKPGEIILNGKYRIEKMLGEGAFGEVYLATHQNLKALRALKVLHKEEGGPVGSTVYGNARRRFLQESELGAMLGNHPHLIQVMDFDEVEDLMVLALEYAPGGSLADRLEAARRVRHPLEVAEAVRTAAEVADGLAVLHDPLRNIVHRDIKPSNILFDGSGHAKVADLGLAQVPHGASMRSRFSQPEHHPGTPVYMSPEQESTFDYLGFTSDIYSLGVTLFEMLTLSPYSTRTLRPGTRLKTLRPDAPAWLDDLVMRMLSKEPQERPFDGAEAAKELRQARVSAAKAVEAEFGSTPVKPGETKKIEASQETQGAELRDALEAAIKYQEWEEAEGLLREYEVADPGSRLVKIYRKQVDRGMEPILAARKAAEEKAKQEAAERERKAAEEKARREAEERERKAAEEKARLEAAERERKAAEEKARLEAAERARKAAEEKARLEASERELKAAEEKAMQDAAERERKATEEKARLEAAEHERKAAEEKARREAEERARKMRQEGDRLWVKLAQGVEMEFVRVPAGKFKMGSNESDDEKPMHDVHLDEYWMGRYPVTNAQYAAFVKASGQSRPSRWGKEGAIPGGLENHPVVNVSWEDARIFCGWLSRESGQKIGLPTEAQWEKAARGTDGRAYPWGNQEPDATRCNFNWNVKNTTPVGKYSPVGDSPCGCADLAGNVWEWCADWYDAGYYGKTPQSNPTGPSTGNTRVLRGGSWNYASRYVRSAYRFGGNPGNRNYFRGFRCALSLLDF